MAFSVLKDRFVMFKERKHIFSDFIDNFMLFRVGKGLF